MKEVKTRSLLDKDIRPALVKHVVASERDCVLFHELPLARGACRADVVAVNGHISGFEIKSERDTLARLAQQIMHYDLICEYSSIVVAEKHLAGAKRLLPRHWGILAIVAEDEPRFLQIREPRKNFELNTQALIRLLWKPECAAILRKYYGQGCPHPTASVVKHWETMETIPASFLLQCVRDALKRRSAKQSAAQQMPCDD